MYSSNAIPTSDIAYLEAVYLEIIFSIVFQCKKPEKLYPEWVEYFRIVLNAGHLYVKMKAIILEAAKNSPSFNILSQSISVIEANEKDFNKQIEKCIPELKATKAKL